MTKNSDQKWGSLNILEKVACKSKVQNITWSNLGYVFVPPRSTRIFLQHSSTLSWNTLYTCKRRNTRVTDINSQAQPSVEVLQNYAIWRVYTPFTRYIHKVMIFKHPEVCKWNVCHFLHTTLIDLKYTTFKKPVFNWIELILDILPIKYGRNYD